MAQLLSDKLMLEVNFSSIENEWVNYDIRFFWNNEFIIRDEILKREGKYWGGRKYGTFLANDYQSDSLIDIIKEALDTYKATCWEPMEPDARIAIYPGLFFPFLETPYNLFEEMEALRIKRLEKQKKEEEDFFTIITFIDAYNFKESFSYDDVGISLHMVVDREKLEKFSDDLKKEYDKLIKEVMP
jgi:hypothetical protein